METSTCLIVLATCGCLMAVSSKEVKRDTRSAAQAIVDNWMTKQPGGAVAAVLVSPGDTQTLFAGNLQPTSADPPNEHTMFEIGSVTKGFTGILLADQVMSKKVKLEDTLAKLLTDWPGRTTSAAGSVTLQQLATHSSGLPRLPANMNPHAANPYATYGKDELYAWLDTITSLQPGSYLYSNVGFGILGHALAVVNGKSYEELLRERVLIPMGLEDATFTLDASQTSRLAPPHDINGNPTNNWDFNVIAPAGGLRCSIADLEHFLQFTTSLDQKATSVQDIFKVATHNFGNTDHGYLTIGLGWHRSQLQDKLLIWHNGATGGYNSFVAWYPDFKVGVAVIVNTANGDNSAEVLGGALLNTKVQG